LRIKKENVLSYWAWLCVYVFAPILAMLVWRRDTIIRRWKTVLFCAIGSLGIAVPWDHFAIMGGLWRFPPGEVIGIWLLGLPLEEWLFISFIGMEVAMMALIFMEERHV